MSGMASHIPMALSFLSTVASGIHASGLGKPAQPASSAPPAPAQNSTNPSSGTSSASIHTVQPSVAASGPPTVATIALCIVSATLRFTPSSCSQPLSSNVTSSPGTQMVPRPMTSAVRRVPPPASRNRASPTVKYVIPLLRVGGFVETTYAVLPQSAKVQ